MRPLTNEELKKIDILKDGIRGNIARMCVTKDYREIAENIALIASKVQLIANINVRRFDNRSNGQKGEQNGNEE